MTAAEVVNKEVVSRKETNGNSGSHVEESHPFETLMVLGPSVIACDPETMEIQLILSHQKEKS